jgi:hypothetical protein
VTVVLPPCRLICQLQLRKVRVFFKIDLPISHIKNPFSAYSTYSNKDTLANSALRDLLFSNLKSRNSSEAAKLFSSTECIKDCKKNNLTLDGKIATNLYLLKRQKNKQPFFKFRKGDKKHLKTEENDEIGKMLVVEKVEID